MKMGIPPSGPFAPICLPCHMQKRDSAEEAAGSSKMSKDTVVGRDVSYG